MLRLRHVLLAAVLLTFLIEAVLAAHPLRLPTLNAASEIGLGDDIMVHWHSSSLEGAHPLDWIGLYRKGTCEQPKLQTAPVAGATADISMTSRLDQNTCHLSSQSLPGSLEAGTIIFSYQDIKLPAGEYEVRYFLGDSTHEQGVTCRDMKDLPNGLDYSYCAYEASAVSGTIHITGTMSFVPTDQQEARDLGYVRVNY